MTAFDEVHDHLLTVMREKDHDFTIADDLLNATWPEDTLEAQQAVALMDAFITMVSMRMPIKKCLANLAVTFYKAGQIAGPDPVYEHLEGPLDGS